MALRELLATFGVQVDDGQLKGFDKNIKATVDNISKLGKALVGGLAVRAIGGFIVDQIDMADALQTTADKLGVGFDELQRFQYAADQLDAPVESANKALQFLNKNIGEAGMGNKTAAESLAKLGVETKNADGSMRSAVDIVADAADHFESLESQGAKTALAMRLFGKGGVEMIPMLQSGGDAVRKLMAEVDDLGGVMSDEYSAQINDADMSMKRWHFTMRNAKARIVSAVLPAFTALVTRGSKLVASFVRLDKRVHILRDLLKGLAFFGLVRVVKGLHTVAGPVMAAVKAFRAMSVSLFEVGVPLWLLLAGLALLYLAVDDIFALMRGDKSVIGEYLDEFGGAGTAAELAKSLNEAWVGVSDAFSQAGAAFGLAWETIKQALGTNGIALLTSLFVGLVKVVAGLGVALAAAAGALAALLTGDTSGAGKIIDKAGEAIFGKTTSFFDQKSGKVVTQDVGGLFGATQKDLAKEMPELAARGAFGVGQIPVGVPGSQFAGPPTAPTSISNEVKTNIVINGATDPQATANAVAKVQTGALDQANQDAFNATQSFGPDSS